MAVNKRVTIGDFNISKIGNKYFVFKDQWIKELSKSDYNKDTSFNDVLNEAYDTVCKYCRSIALPSPPKPRLEL